MIPPLSGLRATVPRVRLHRVLSMGPVRRVDFIRRTTGVCILSTDARRSHVVTPKPTTLYRQSGSRREQESSRWCERSVSGGVIGSCDKAPKPRLPPRVLTKSTYTAERCRESLGSRLKVSSPPLTNNPSTYRPKFRVIQGWSRVGPSRTLNRTEDARGG